MSKGARVLKNPPRKSRSEVEASSRMAPSMEEIRASEEAFLDRMTDDIPEGFYSVSAWMKAWNLRDAQTRHRIKTMVESGFMERRVFWSRRMDGHCKKFPYYRLKTNGKG